jgi:hypothetical protein
MPKKKNHGFGGVAAWDEATLTMHGAKYVNMPNPKSNPFTPPGDTRATF